MSLFFSRALPSSTNEPDIPVPNGMSLNSFKRLVDKAVLNPNQLEEVSMFVSKLPIFILNYQIVFYEASYK